MATCPVRPPSVGIGIAVGTFASWVVGGGSDVGVLTPDIADRSLIKQQLPSAKKEQHINGADIVEKVYGYVHCISSAPAGTQDVCGSWSNSDQVDLVARYVKIIASVKAQLTASEERRERLRTVESFKWIF